MYYKCLNRYKLLSKPTLNHIQNVFSNKSLFRFVSFQSHKKRLDPELKIKPKNRNSNKFLYIKDKEIAEIVVKHLSNDLLSDDSIIFESNPGMSALTQQLLRSGAQLVRVFEDNPFFLDNLKKLQKQYRNRLEIIPKQIQNIPNFWYNYSKTYDSEIKECFEGVSVREWSSCPPIKFVAVLSPTNSTPFLRFVLKQLIRKELFFSFGRTEFLVFVSERESKYMTADTGLGHNYLDYRSVTVLYQTLFDIETFEAVPYEQFGIYTNPNDTLRKPKKLKGNAKLVRLRPKLYLESMDSLTLEDYFYFVNQTFMKRKNYIIPYLENWFPNCGPELIRKGIPVFKYFGDLRPEEVLDLFKYFQNRTDYNNSLYKAFSNRDNYLDEDFEYSKDEDDLQIEIDARDRPSEIELSDSET